MDEEKVESLLHKAKDLIPVDDHLKKQLRKSFESKKKKKINSTILYAITLAAILFLSFVFVSQPPKTVNAIELLVTNAISFIDVANGDIQTIANHEGRLYVTMKNQEVYTLNTSGLGLSKIATKEAENLKHLLEKEDLTIEGRFTIYEDKGNILIKDLKKNETTIVDKGHSPSINRTGDYIAYIKEDNGMDQIWIADTNLKTKKQLTTNLLQRDSTKPLYQYRTPVWGEENAIYLIKERMFDDEIEETRLMQIELSTEKLTSEQTVHQFMQALMVRDDDYAKSLMVSPPDFLTVSNPRISNYKILSTTEGKHVDEVRVEITRTDSHLPYLNNNLYTFKLNEVDGSYKIKEVTEDQSTTISSVDMKTIQLIQNGETRALFTLDQLNKQEIKTSEYRFSSIAFDDDNNRIYFGIQEMAAEESIFGVSIWVYDMRNNELTFLKRMEQIQDDSNLVLESMLVSTDQNYIALNIFSESNLIPSVYILDLTNLQNEFYLDQSYATYWRGEELIYESINPLFTTLQSIKVNDSKTPK
ncbi:hypothetical protein [Lysinibacillus antri]|uniref:Uncharacterized protein n=1 Tax=Lysinibacillus antri TaxID=2498145 RepID=A0A432LA57_9BACI|nr:hypothetical protein [Lysinibacillus antri]RUL50886.1 hypothetical protein EK386_13135 [Lysinibacillus antri]